MSSMKDSTLEIQKVEDEIFYVSREVEDERGPEEFSK
jgi:hypothetical protein